MTVVGRTDCPAPTCESVAPDPGDSLVQGANLEAWRAGDYTNSDPRSPWTNCGAAFASRGPDGPARASCSREFGNSGCCSTRDPILSSAWKPAAGS